MFKTFSINKPHWVEVEGQDVWWRKTSLPTAIEFTDTKRLNKTSNNPSVTKPHIMSRFKNNGVFWGKDAKGNKWKLKTTIRPKKDYMIHRWFKTPHILKTVAVFRWWEMGEEATVMGRTKIIDLKDMNDEIKQYKHMFYHPMHSELNKPNITFKMPKSIIAESFSPLNKGNGKKVDPLLTQDEDYINYMLLKDYINEKKTKFNLTGLYKSKQIEVPVEHLYPVIPKTLLFHSPYMSFDEQLSYIKRKLPSKIAGLIPSKDDEHKNGRDESGLTNYEMEKIMELAREALKFDYDKHRVTDEDEPMDVFAQSSKSPLNITPLIYNYTEQDTNMDKTVAKNGWYTLYKNAFLNCGVHFIGHDVEEIYTTGATHLKKVLLKNKGKIKIFDNETVMVVDEKTGKSDFKKFKDVEFLKEDGSLGMASEGTVYTKEEFNKLYKNSSTWHVFLRNYFKWDFLLDDVLTKNMGKRGSVRLKLVLIVHIGRDV